MAEEKCACACSSVCDGDFSEAEIEQCVAKIIDTNKGKKGALIPVLQEIQKELGYLPESAMRKVSKDLDISYSEVAGVVGFYSFFSTVPKGKNMVRVCLGTACYVRGGKNVLEALKDKLGIDVGETTSDRMFSLEIGRCFGACGLAPVVMINDDVHQRVRPAKIDQLLDAYKNTCAGGGEK